MRVRRPVVISHPPRRFRRRSVADRPPRRDRARFPPPSSVADCTGPDDPLGRRDRPPAHPATTRRRYATRDAAADRLAPRPPPSRPAIRFQPRRAAGSNSTAITSPVSPVSPNAFRFREPRSSNATMAATTAEQDSPPLNGPPPLAFDQNLPPAREREKPPSSHVVRTRRPFVRPSFRPRDWGLYRLTARRP